MARKRCIPTKLFFDPDFMSLSSNTIRLIWIGLVLDADDYGRGEAHTDILGRKFGQAISDIEQAMRELETQGLLQCYEVEGRRYYWLPDWNKLQTLSKPTPSEFPPAPGDMTTPQNPQGNSGDARETSLEGEGEGEKESRIEDEVVLNRGNRGDSAATTSGYAAMSMSNSYTDITNHPTDTPPALAESVAKVLRLPLTPDLKQVVEEYTGKVSVSTAAHRARDYIDDPKRNKRQKEMSVSYFRNWLEREWGFKAKENRAAIVKQIAELAARHAG
jgi:hypothetical protein